MTAKSKTVLASSVVGIFSGLLVALAVMPLIPIFAREATPGRVNWGLALGSPIGFIVGAACGAFLYGRAKQVDRFQQLLVEISVIAALVTGIVIQFMLPFRWPLPRFTITAIACLAATGLAVLSAVVLRPLYWRIGPTKGPTYMDRAASLRRLAEKLEQLQKGELPCDRRFVSECLAADAHPDAWDVVANVEHYIADEDIRKREREYKHGQERHLSELIAALRAAAPRDDLLAFNFLSFNRK